MFTPPPSPLPPRSKRSGDRTGDSSDTCSQELSFAENKDRMAQEDFLRSVEAKQRTARKLRRAVLLFPILLVGLTICISTYWTDATLRPCLSTPSSSSSSISDSSAESPRRWQWHGILNNDPSRWSLLLKRSPQQQGGGTGSGGGGTGGASSSTNGTNASTTTTTSGSGGLPTTTQPASLQPLPTVPSTIPPLPTPFPQAFDGNLQQNFSSASCLTFFTNMTNSIPFRSCRPFSLLLDTSSTFNNAQSNLTLLNNLVWGTCNTNTTYSQCQSNMNWFANNLKTACALDLQNQAAMVTGTLVGLQAFSIMHEAACLIEPTTNSYCFVSAARSSSSDLYYYQLPIGIPLPAATLTSVTCSACSKSVMSLYAKALQDPSQRDSLSGLKDSYDSSARLSAQFCGASFAPTNLASGAGLSVGVEGVRRWMAGAVMGVLTVVLS